MSDTIAEPMDDNDALREILGEVRLLDALLRAQYDDIEHSEDNPVTDTVPFKRTARPTAVKTVVVNQGTEAVEVFEGGALVKRVDPHDNWVSPTNGSGIITVYAANPSTASTVSIATYLKDG